MGIPLSLLSKIGVPGVGSLSTDKILYDKYFKDEKIENFEQFHTAFIDLCKFLNDIIPGKHYDAPTRKEIEEFYKEWMALEIDEEKKRSFFEFMLKNVKESRSDDQAVIMAGVVAPAAAIFVKKTSDNIPQVKRFKLHLIPNFIFVPSCTIFALAGVRFVQINKRTKA